MARRAGATASDPGTSGSTPASLTRQPSPAAGEGDAAEAFFREHFVSPACFAWLAAMGAVGEVLRTPMQACGLAAWANRDGDEGLRERARRCYGRAIAATNAAIRDVGRVREDETVGAVVLLACFEVRVPLGMGKGGADWRFLAHFVGCALRGSFVEAPCRGRSAGALASGAGTGPDEDGRAAVPRDPGYRRTSRPTTHPTRLTAPQITNSMLSEQEVPAYIVEWSKLLPNDPLRTPSDHLALLTARCAALRAAFRSAAHPDQALARTADALEHDLLHWAAEHSTPGSPAACTAVPDPHSPRAWNGARHVYGSPAALAHWTGWRCARVLVSRVQEALWRRSWPVLAAPGRAVPAREHFVGVRERVVEEICGAVALELGDAGEGGGASGLLLLVALTLAGTCLIERLGEASVCPDGRRVIRVDRPLHLDPFDRASTQLAWVIGRVEHVAEVVGVRWARTVSSFLKGETGVYYEVCRS